MNRAGTFQIEKFVICIPISAGNIGIEIHMYSVGLT